MSVVSSSQSDIVLLVGTVLQIYCKSIKYSGNKKIAKIALCPYALL